MPLEESLTRILTGRPQLKYYEAGLDLGLSDDPYESFRLFQGLILDEYDKMVDEFDLTVIDATRPLLEQQDEVRNRVGPHLKNVVSIQPNPWREVLSRERLHGRYIENIPE